MGRRPRRRRASRSRSSTARTSSCPPRCLLYGYGAYEISIDPSFSPHRLSLLDRGVVFAIAHVRGGGEMGRAWYEDGRMEHKANTFSRLHRLRPPPARRRDRPPGPLVGRGGSAGGLLIGAVANQAPELFRALVAEVPFVDCVTTMLDDELPLTVGEWEEWGNPLADESAYWRMLTYSPYDNVTGQNPDGSPRPYPDLFVTAGLNDPRVAYWEPAKWVAKLRAESPVDQGAPQDRARAPATAGPRAATTPGRKRPWSTPSSSTCWGWPTEGWPTRRGRRWRRSSWSSTAGAVWKFSVNGAWLPGGSVTGDPLTVAANAPGAPAITVTGPVAATAWDWPGRSVAVKSTAPVAVLVASTQHSPVVAATVSE